MNNGLGLKKNANFVRKFAFYNSLAPRVGFEPTTDRLTADCSATELPRKMFFISEEQQI